MFVFQTDADIVRNVYDTQHNYLIEYNEQCKDKTYCAVYFCSNDLYYPNVEDIFRKRIVEKNFFEWYNLRIEKAYKHIFVRDVFKQWYLSGINQSIDSPERLIEFLKNETDGYRTIMSGSSAGGYAAILYGSILKVERVFAFNPQVELTSLLTKSNEKTNPLIFRLKDGPYRKYFDIVPFIMPMMNIYYFFSNQSRWDIEQRSYLGDTKGIHLLPFRSTHHGIPFLKVALPVILNMEDIQLKKFENKIQHPLIFTMRLVGLRKTIIGFFSQVYATCRKRR